MPEDLAFSSVFVDLVFLPIVKINTVSDKSVKVNGADVALL